MLTLLALHGVDLHRQTDAHSSGLENATFKKQQPNCSCGETYWRPRLSYQHQQ